MNVYDCIYNSVVDFNNAINSLWPQSGGTIVDGDNALHSMDYPVNSVKPDNTDNKPIHEIPFFPQDVWNEVLKHSKPDLVALSVLSQSLNKLTNDYAKSYRPEGCFGKAEWISYGGNPGAEPYLPLKMIQDFDSSKWMLTFIPETINGEELTLSSFDRFVSDYKNGKDAFRSNYRYLLSDYDINDKTVKPFKSHWVMLSKDVLGCADLVNGTRNKNFSIQEKLVKEAGFEIPNLIDAVVSILLRNLQTGDFVYSDGSNGHQRTYTHVQEQNSGGYPIAVGSFSALGLVVYDSDDFDYMFNFSSLGASCARKSICT